MAPDDLDISARRYRLLVEQVRDELGGERGWKERAAERLGVSGAFIGYVERGEREGGADAQKKAMRKLGLDFRFFHDAALGARPHYRDHIVAGPELHWATFKKRYPRIGELSEEQLGSMKEFAARSGMKIRSWTDYERLADMVLRDKPSEIFEAAKKSRG